MPALCHNRLRQRNRFLGFIPVNLVPHSRVIARINSVFVENGTLFCEKGKRRIILADEID